jgi:hypothetical protein
MSDLKIKQYTQFLSNKIQACHSESEAQDAKTFLEIQSILLCMAGQIKDLEQQLKTFQNEITKLGEAIHYPDCWDTVAYPTLFDALSEINNCNYCSKGLKDET